MDSRNIQSLQQTKSLKCSQPYHNPFFVTRSFLQQPAKMDQLLEDKIFQFEKTYHLINPLKVFGFEHSSDGGYETDEDRCKLSRNYRYYYYILLIFYFYQIIIIPKYSYFFYQKKFIFCLFTHLYLCYLRETKLPYRQACLSRGGQETSRNISRIWWVHFVFFISNLSQAQPSKLLKFYFVLYC